MIPSLRILAATALAFAVLCPAPSRAGPAVLRHLPASRPNTNSFVLTSPEGVKVFLDVIAVPDDLQPAVDDPRNVFLVTHRHPDHFAGTTAQRFKGGKRVADPGTLASGDVKIEVVPSSHFDDDVDGTSDTIVVVDLAGFRVAHFGDCGQSTLTREQMQRIGRVDVMIGQFENAFSDADIINRKGFKVLAQVAPAMLIPTHLLSSEAVKLLQPTYPPEWAQRNEIVLSKELLAKGKRAVFMGANVELARQTGVPASPDL